MCVYAGISILFNQVRYEHSHHNTAVDFAVAVLFFWNRYEPEASWMSSPSGFCEAESEWGHTPQAELALLQVCIPTLRQKKKSIL